MGKMYLRLKIKPDNQAHDLNDHIDKMYGYFKTKGSLPITQYFILAPINKAGEIYYDVIADVDTITEDSRSEASQFISHIICKITYHINNGYTYKITYRTITYENAEKLMDDLSFYPGAKAFPDPNTNPIGAVIWENLVNEHSPMGKIKYPEANNIVD
jgi:hypothetical protein